MELLKKRWFGDRPVSYGRLYGRQVFFDSDFLEIGRFWFGIGMGNVF